MENKLTSIKERILEVVKNEGFKREDFFKKIGMTYGSFKGKAKQTPINSDALANILSIIPNIDLTWLITGIKKEKIDIAGLYQGPYDRLYKNFQENELQLKLLKHTLELKEKECDRLYNLLLANKTSTQKKTA